jgi:hypothetical protein
MPIYLVLSSLSVPDGSCRFRTSCGLIADRYVLERAAPVEDSAGLLGVGEAVGR